MHRFDEAGRIPFVKRMHDQGLIASISVGVKEYEYDFVSQLKADAPEYITIDIAHGHAAVSYTHLDVYKRQELYGQWCDPLVSRG